MALEDELDEGVELDELLEISLVLEVVELGVSLIEDSEDPHADKDIAPKSKARKPRRDVEGVCIHVRLLY